MTAKIKEIPSIIGMKKKEPKDVNQVAKSIVDQLIERHDPASKKVSKSSKPSLKALSKKKSSQN